MLRRVFRGVANQERTNLTAYAVPQGYAPLREQLARRLHDRDIAASPDDILLTDSATRSIDLVCRFFLQPGDTVLIDDPGYFNFQAMLQAQRVTAIGVPYTPAGPDLDLFAAACIEHRPKLYLTTGVMHNPTGMNIGIGAAHRLLKLAGEHDLVIVDDCIAADLGHRAVPGLAALDRFERVVLVGSFSKTLGGALRCGFIATRSDWIDGLTDLALATSFGASDVAAQAVHRLIVNGSYRRTSMRCVRGLPRRWRTRRNISGGLASRSGQNPRQACSCGRGYRMVWTPRTLPCVRSNRDWPWRRAMSSACQGRQAAICASMPPNVPTSASSTCWQEQCAPELTYPRTQP
jgi:DNA-binding transcriptional MocR family regulator